MVRRVRRRAFTSENLILALSAGGLGVVLSLVYGVSTADPLTFTAVPVLLLAVGLIACLVPARRATKVNPIEALRYE